MGRGYRLVPGRGRSGRLVADVDPQALDAWEYKSWPLYGVCMGCGAAYSSMHAAACPRPGRQDIQVVPVPPRDTAADEPQDLEARGPLNMPGVPTGRRARISHRPDDALVKAARALADAVRGLDSYAALGGAPVERTQRASQALADWEALDAALPPGRALPPEDEEATA
jgi:hypothetical protein